MYSGGYIHNHMQGLVGGGGFLPEKKVFNRCLLMLVFVCHSVTIEGTTMLLLTPHHSSGNLREFNFFSALLLLLLLLLTQLLLGDRSEDKY